MKLPKQPDKQAQPEQPKRTTLYNAIGQFAPIPHSVIKLIPIIGDEAFVLYCYFVYRTGSKNVCYPSYDKIHDDLGWRRNKIRDAIVTLNKNGLLDYKRRFGGSTVYILKEPPKPPVEEILKSIESDTTGDDEENDPNSINSGTINSTKSGTTLVSNPVLKQDTVNKTHINKMQLSHAPDGAPQAPPAPTERSSLSGKRRTQAQKRGDGVDMVLDQQLLKLPALETYRRVARLHVPISMRQKVAEEVKDVQLWEETIIHWIGHGWNKQNILGLLDSYHAGGKAACNQCHSQAFPKRGQAAPSLPQQKERMSEEEIADFQAKLFGTSVTA